jgi:hypothetical protein
MESMIQRGRQVMAETRLAGPSQAVNGGSGCRLVDTDSNACTRLAYEPPRHA